VDSLALLWNYDHYRATELGRPQQDMKTFLTELEELKEVKGKKIERASIALGTSENVDQSTDVLLHLFQQYGVDFYTLGDTKVDITNKDAVKAFDLYTSFANTSSSNYTWNDQMNDDIYEFIKGNVSTIIGYSYLIEQVAVQARTSGLDFRVSPFPQQTPKSPVYFADYWAYTVGKSDDELKVRYGWDLLIHMTEKDSMETYFDMVKRPPSRRDLLSSYEDDPMYGPYVQQDRYAKSMITYDKSQYDDALETAIQTVVNKEQKSLKALQDAAEQMNKVIELYAE
jgi:ABC-type glycerol-3-phosphate transport system substrate-binding protein